MFRILVSVLRGAGRTETEKQTDRQTYIQGVH